jgi:hypothetical protein
MRLRPFAPSWIVTLAALACQAAGPDLCSAAVTGTDNCFVNSWTHGASRGGKVVGAYVSLGYWDLERAAATFSELSRCGVNLAIDYALTAPEDETWRPAFEAYLNMAADAGIGVVLPLYPTLCGVSPDAAGTKLDDVVTTIRQLKAYPQIAAWYVHDEVLPHMAGVDGSKDYCVSLEQMKELYRRIKSEDPDRPQINVWCSLPTFERFNIIYDEQQRSSLAGWMQTEATYEQGLAEMVRETCDWVLVDCYPVGAPWRKGVEASKLEDVGLLVRRAAFLKRPEQPLIFVFQSFSWQQYHAEKAAGAPFPSLADMHSMLYSAWDNGARGAIAYSWFDVARGDLPGATVPGRERALRNLQRVLSTLSQPDWPRCDQPE